MVLSDKIHEYEHVRADFGHGDILLCSRPVTLFDRAICWWTCSKWFHVLIVDTKHGDKPWCFESVEPQGVRHKPLWWEMWEADQDGYHLDWFRLKGYQGGGIVEWFRERVGCRYPTGWQMFWDYVCREPADANGRWDCSQALALALESVGWRGEKSPLLATPGDVARYSCYEHMGRLKP